MAARCSAAERRVRPPLHRAVAAEACAAGERDGNLGGAAGKERRFVVVLVREMGEGSALNSSVFVPASSIPRCKPATDVPPSESSSLPPCPPGRLCRLGPASSILPARDVLTRMHPGYAEEGALPDGMVGTEISEGVFTVLCTGSFGDDYRGLHGDCMCRHPNVF
jgi:hypothetical protein